MKNPITRIQNSTSTEKISPEVKKQIDAQFQEKVSPLREQRIKEVTAQVQPVSAITPKQPINDNRVTAPIEKKKEVPEGFHDLLKDSLMEKEAEKKTCPSCNGKGTVAGEECPRCGGDKEIEEEKKKAQQQPINEEAIQAAFVMIKNILFDKQSNLEMQDIKVLIQRMQEYIEYGIH